MRRRNEHQKSKRLRNRRRIAAVLTLSMMMSGFQGASLPVFAEESAETVVEGGEDRIRLRLDAAALRAAAENAVQSGSSISLGGSIFAGSGLRDSYEGYFTDAHTLYELSLDEIDAELPAELSAREVGLRVFIEPNPYGAAFTEDTTVALYAPDGVLAELLRGGDIYNGTEAPRFESTGEADYTLSGRARLTFLYQNDGEKAKTFTLEVGERKLDTVKVKPARKLMPGVLSAVEKNIREELETETRAPETSTEQTTVAESAESTVEESRAAETAEPEETAAENPEAGNPGGENPEAETETAAEAAAENTETGAPAEAESEEAKTEASETSAEGIAAGLATASLRPVEGFGILIRRAVRHIFTLGVIEARAEEQDGAAEITETEAAVPETAAAETEAQAAEPEKETAAAPENSGEESAAAPETGGAAAGQESAAESTPETGTEQTTAAAGTAIAETGSPETAGTSAAAPLPDTDMGERRAALEQLRQADAREYLAAIVMQQYGASKLFRDVENERKLTVRYRAQLGGTVSRAEETVDVLAEDAAFLGATAEANQKYYSFDGWENTAGEIVSTEPTLIPELDEIKTNTTFTARFVRNVEMPAFRKTWTGDRLIVTVDVPENTFPKGTELRAQEVGEEAAREIVQAAAGSEQEISRAVAVDLSFFYEGQELQPENGNEVRVTMTLSGDRRMDDPIVVHQHDGEAAEAITDTAEITRNSRTQTLEFSAEKFSIYGIGDVKPVMTYRFHDADGGLLAASYTDAEGRQISLTEQRVKRGDTVYAPQSPEKENHVFLGWSTTQGKTELGVPADEHSLSGDRAAFERFTITTEIKKDNAGEVDYYPVFAERYFIYFMDSPMEGSTEEPRVLAVESGAPGTTVSLKNELIINRVSKKTGQDVVGWSLQPGGEPVAVEGESLYRFKDPLVKLYPIVKDGHYVYFHTGEGGNYIAPVFVAADADIPSPGVPSRAGYRYKYWTKDPAPNSASQKFEGFDKKYSEPEDALHLYVLWAPDSTSYTVRVWKQKLTDRKDAADAEKQYDFWMDFEREDFVTTETAIENVLGSEGKNGTKIPVIKDSYYNWKWLKITVDEGFHYNEDRTKAEAVGLKIRGDGTTVLNIYLDRNLMTIRFRYPDPQKNDYVFMAQKSGDKYYHDGKEVDESEYFIGEEVTHTERVLVEPAHEETRWKKVWHWEGIHSHFEWVEYKVWVEDKYEDKEVSDGYKVYRKALYYTGLYGSSLKDNGYTWPTDAQWAYESKDEKLQSGHLTVLDIFDFAQYEYAEKDGFNNKTKLYLRADTDKGAVYEHYLQDLNGNYPDKPTIRIDGGKGTYTINNKFRSGFSLAGYRKDNGSWIPLSDSDEGGKIKRYKTLSFYYQRREFNLTFFDRDEGKLTSERVKYEASLETYEGKRPEKNNVPITKEGYEFAGWALNSENGSLFDFSEKMPAGDVLLYAKWKKAEYTVTVHGMPGDTAAAPESFSLAKQYQDVLTPEELPTVRSGEKEIFVSENTTQTLTVAEGMNWAGWTVKDEKGSYIPYVFGAKITNSLDIYANYYEAKPFTLTYDLLGNASSLGSITNSADFNAQGESGQYIDTTKYAAGGAAVLLGTDAVGLHILPVIERKENNEEAAAGTKQLLFLGWQLDAGSRSAELLQPNDTIQINGDTKVHAVYGEPEDLVAVEYLANYPELKGLVDKPKQEYVQSSIPNNNTVSAATYSASGFAEIPDSYEYEFKGWTKDKRNADALKNKAEDELKTILLKEGDPFQVDKPEIGADDKPIPNLLYAYWERKPAVTLTIRNVIKGTMANAADQFEYTVTVTKPGEAPATLPKFKLDGQADTTWSGDTIPVGAKVEVVMTKIDPNYTSSAVKTPKTAGDPEKYEENNGAVTVAEFEMKENTTLTFTHELDAVTPTGIVKDNLPFLLMLLAAGGMGAYFLLGRRRRDEDEL